MGLASSRRARWLPRKPAPPEAKTSRKVCGFIVQAKALGALRQRRTSELSHDCRARDAVRKCFTDDLHSPPGGDEIVLEAVRRWPFDHVEEIGSGKPFHEGFGRGDVEDLLRCEAVLTKLQGEFRLDV